MIESPDLSRIHGLIGELFRPTQAPRALSAAEVEEFRREGFLLGPRLLDAHQLHALRCAVDDLVAGRASGMDRLPLRRSDRRGGDGHEQWHVSGAWRVAEAIHDLVFASAVTLPVSQLLGHPRPLLFRDQIFVKQPLSPGLVPWHQDYSDWMHTTPPTHTTCWIALDDTTPENGCIHYLPRSHTQGILPKINMSDDMESALQRLPTLMREGREPRAVAVSAGCCVFHHCLTVHASYGNRTNQIRRGISLTFMHPHTRSTDAQRPVGPGCPAVPRGELIAGPLFPSLGDL
ncbi:MAG: phytanoyl-CoA dioxygenase family protein [Myxococcales bacterium]|nr:phytanoyl-CoA dioxygenase family protein [Myxococcales bacterium]